VPPILAHDPHTYRRLRWRARAWTVGFGVVLVPMVADVVQRYGSDDEQIRRGAAWIAFQACLVAVAAAFVLRFQWTRSYRARPHRLHTDDSDWVWRGVPEMDAPPREHLSLNGDGVLPPRW
jgi:hypothetical protein